MAVHQKKKKKKKRGGGAPWFSVCADFCGVNIPTMASFCCQIVITECRAEERCVQWDLPGTQLPNTAMIGDSTRDRHPAFVKLADRSALGGSPFKTEEKRMKGDVKEERSHLGSTHGSRKLPEVSSAAVSAAAQFRHVFPLLLSFLLSSFPLWAPWPLTTLRRCLVLQKLQGAEEIPRSW